MADEAINKNVETKKFTYPASTKLMEESTSGLSILNKK